MQNNPLLNQLAFDIVKDKVIEDKNSKSESNDEKSGMIENNNKEKSDVINNNNIEKNNEIVNNTNNNLNKTNIIYNNKNKVGIIYRNTYYLNKSCVELEDKYNMIRTVNTEKGNLIIYCVYIPPGEKHDIRVKEFIERLLGYF